MEEKGQEEGIVPTDGRSWYGWNGQIERRRNDNGSQLDIALDQFRITEVKWFPVVPKRRM